VIAPNAKAVGSMARRSCHTVNPGMECGIGSYTTFGKE
jgi:hypothetical protein